MKKSITKVLALVLALVFCAGVMAACGNSSGETTTAAPETTTTKAAETTTAAPETTAEETEAGLSGDVIVFAAASMKETLTEIGEVFTQDNPDVNLIFTFDSSGTLKTQIEEGADCDIFISAGQKQMNQLDIEADPSVNTDGLDFVDFQDASFQLRPIDGRGPAFEEKPPDHAGGFSDIDGHFIDLG